MKPMEHIEKVIRQVEQEIEKLQSYERQIVIDRLMKKYGSSIDAMVVGSNYNFWLNPEDDVYDKL